MLVWMRQLFVMRFTFNRKTENHSREFDKLHNKIMHNETLVF